MNDSFLEDLALVTAPEKAGSAVHHAERNITRRRSQPSPVPPSVDHDELNQLIAEHNARPKIMPSKVGTKISCRRSADGHQIVKEPLKPSSVEIQTANVKSRSSDRRIKPTEMKKLNAAEITNHLEMPKAKADKKDYPRWSAGSNRESSRCSDASSKENSRPSDSSKESLTHVETAKERSKLSGDGTPRRGEAEEKFQVAMLNSIKDIVSIYTKNESTKILRAMQEFYISSQSNLLKLMIQQTDDISTTAGNDSPRLRSLVEENGRLRENIAFLEARNNELRKIVDEVKQVKEENLRLKNRCNDLIKSGAGKQGKTCTDGSSKENSRPTSSPKDNSSPKTRARQFMELYRNPK